MTVWEATLSSRGQVAIQRDMQQALNLRRPGDQLVCGQVDREIIVTPENIDVKDLVGCLEVPTNGPARPEEIDTTIIRAAGSNLLDTGDHGKSDVAA